MFSFGKMIHLQVFGQSHSAMMGMVLDGFPAGIGVDEDALAAFMTRRAPGNSPLSTARKEADRVEFVSGVENGRTTGAPICAVIANENTRSQDYEQLRDLPRPSHADFAAFARFGSFRDHRGGGEFSGRLTAPLCVAGFLCRTLLEQRGIFVGAHISSVGGVSDDRFDPVKAGRNDLCAAAGKEFPVLNDASGEQMREVILAAKNDGDSVGGTVECALIGLPAGTGGTSFDGIESKLAQALFAIPAVKGVEFGSGFAGCERRGSENNDDFTVENGRIATETNAAGGILGGLASGMPVVFRVGVKPTPSIEKEQQSVSLSSLKEEKLSVKGRHDPCILPRVVPVVEAVTAIAAADMILTDYGVR